MSKLLTPEDRAKFLGLDQDVLSQPQQGPSRATERLTPTRTPSDGICLSDRPEMPRGWLNSYEGHSWMIRRCEAFSRMKSGRMNFGFLPKNKDK